MPHQSLRIAAASYALDLADSALVVRAADEALDDGVYAHGLGELILMRNPTWAECSPWFASALRELQIPLPRPVEAVMTLVEYHAVRLAEGAVTPSEGLAEFYALYQDLGIGEYCKLSSDELTPLRPFVDRYYGMDYYHSLGPNEVDVGRLDRLQAETIQRADDWCREHWAGRLRPSWQTANVLAVARGIQADRSFHRLPILADALRDEGCDDEEIMHHLMHSRGHVRTCFVLGLFGKL
jgi:hypothetical protein